MSDSSRFALIEFKYAKSNIPDERRKHRRLVLCRGLSAAGKRDLHDQCHFIAWGENSDVRLNIYRKEVCNCQVFGDASGLSALAPDASTQINGAQFAHEFLNPEDNSRSLGLDEFEIYLQWLMQDTSSSDRTTLQLWVRNPDACTYTHLDSIRGVYQWMQEHRRPSADDTMEWSSPGPEM